MSESQENVGNAPTKFRSDPRLHRARRGISGTYRAYTEEGEKIIFRVWSFKSNETRRPVIFIFPVSYWKNNERVWHVERRNGERQPHLPGSVLFGKCNFKALPDVDIGNAHIEDWCELVLDCVRHYNAKEQERRQMQWQAQG